ncbi:hypothetical protein DFH09DRAFT_1105154 [Mycena vulgaris]|nr:hypothetical protein DFH09DRAFT_1105154 [Mycena vulgaris]
MSFVNFSAQEPLVYGRSNRKPVATKRIQAHNEMQQIKENRRTARELAKTSQARKPSTRAKASTGAHPNPLKTRITQLEGLAPDLHSVQAPTQQHPPDTYPPSTAHPPSPLTPEHGSGLDAAGRAELDMDLDADRSEPDESGGSDNENYTKAVSIDEGLRGLPPADNQITSTPVDLPPAQTRILVCCAVNSSSPAISTAPPAIAYHTPPPPAIPYMTNPRQLTRRTHVFVPAANSSNPSSSPTPAPPKRLFSEVDGGRDERDDPSDDDDDNDQSGALVIVGRAVDLPPVRRHVFDVAARHMCLIVISESPYADSIQLDKMALGAWYTALKELRDTYGYEGSTAPTHDELALLKARVHQVKGDIKTACRDVIMGKKGYDFRQDDSPEDIAHNRQHVTDLLSGNTFLYREPMNCDLPGTLYEHTAHQEVLNCVFYNDEANSEAILTPIYFANGLPLPTGAFISSVLECVISEIQTGRRVKSRMTAKTWQPKFDKHLKTLEGWKVYWKLT